MVPKELAEGETKIGMEPARTTRSRRPFEQGCLLFWVQGCFYSDSSRYDHSRKSESNSNNQYEIV